MIHRLILIILLFLFISCQKSIDPFENGSESYDLNAYQIPGCAGPASFFRNDSTENGCFSYSFEDTLKMELCVSANCCPDSHRFTYHSKIKSNIISFTVVDTAANLCRCICDYRIHADYIGLTGNTYQFNCIYNDTLIYSEVLSNNN